MHKVIDRTVKGKKFIPKEDDDLIVCRCEEITKGEIRKAVFEGMKTSNEVKRFTRAKMGLCQGQTCGRLVREIIAQETGVRREEVHHVLPRSPVRPVPMGSYANDGVMNKIKNQ